MSNMNNNTMDIGSQILSDIIIFSKYSNYLPQLNRRETWGEIIDRNKNMHISKFPLLEEEIEGAFRYVYDKKVLPSMRLCQFSGPAVLKNNARGYNCSWVPIDSILAFPEVMFLLLSGCGVGYSVEKKFIDKLPSIRIPVASRKFVAADSIEGWADCVKALMKAYLNGSPLPKFDFRDIRPKGSPLSSGGLAPGPEPLRVALEQVHSILRSKQAGDRLSTLDCHDIVCHLSTAVLAGGIRRSACIVSFDIDDNLMMNCKSGNWWELNPQRARANNSVTLDPNNCSKGDFWYVWKRCQYSNAGEPGIYWNKSDESWGTNPCQPGFATVLTPYGIRELSDVNIGDSIWSETGWTTILDKWSTGTKSVYKYTTTAGSFVGTKDHRVVSNGVKVRAKNATGIDILTCSTTTQYMEPQVIMDGLVIGDGSVHKASNNLVYLCIGEKDHDYFNSEISDLIVVHRPGLHDYAWEIKTDITHKELPPLPIRTIPHRYVYGNTSIVQAFLRGLYSANGSVIKAGRVSLKSSSKILIEQVQLMLSSIGIRSYYTTNKPKVVKFNKGDYICKQSYDLNITSDCDKFAITIGFIQKYKNRALYNMLSDKKKTIGKKTYDIISTEYLGDFEVFDINVNNTTHTYWTGGVNVSNCGEVALRSIEGERGSGGQFCNLTTVNTTNIESQEDFNNRVKAAALIGTLQASYTDFHYLRPEWRQATEEDALLGISLTGIADGVVLSLNLSEAAKIAVEENKRIAELIGIADSARITLIKPEGTSSSVLGCSSGIHSRHSPFYIRRIRLLKNEPIYLYLKDRFPKLMEDEYFDPENQAVFSIPIKSPENAIYRNESEIDLLNRIKKVYKEWIVPGHKRGKFTHNVSGTISVKPDSYDKVGKWLWNNRKNYMGLACLPYSDANYPQMPFEEITEEEYNKLVRLLRPVDLKDVFEYDNNVKREAAEACSGGSCEIFRV